MVDRPTVSSVRPRVSDAAPTRLPSPGLAPWSPARALQPFLEAVAALLARPASAFERYADSNDEVWEPFLVED